MEKQSIILKKGVLLLGVVITLLVVMALILAYFATSSRRSTDGRTTVDQDTLEAVEKGLRENEARQKKRISNLEKELKGFEWQGE